MRVTFWWWQDSGRGKTRWRFLGSPVGCILVLLAAALVIGFIWCVGKYLHDAYVPYEGEVVAIRMSWAERFILESSEDEHLIIRTPEGRTIDRVVPVQDRIVQSIGVGDHVVKERGFRHRIRLREPKRIPEPNRQPSRLGP
jgi:hypothetical protein